MKYKKEEYSRFKHLLEYFVAHLEYIANGDSTSIGYEEYIKPLVDRNSFKSSGQGYNGQAIQTQVSEWEKYQNGVICINVYGANYQSRGTYLNWKETGANIMADWNSTHIETLYLAYYESDSKERLPQNVSFTIKELGLFDGQIPNENICSFFDKYNIMIESIRNKQHKIETNKYKELLKANSNLILTGAPGTGKTYLAKQIAAEMLGVDDIGLLEANPHYGFVQFHPSYDYTDFIEGLRPFTDKNGNVGFKLKYGVFKEFCERALWKKEEASLELDLSNPKDALMYFKLTCNNITINYFNIVIKDDVIYAKPYEKEWKMPDEDILTYINTGGLPQRNILKLMFPVLVSI